MSTVLFLLDSDGSIRAVDEAALGHLGYLKEELVRRPFSTLAANRESGAFLDALARGEHGLPATGLASLRAKDGRVFPVEFHLTRVPLRVPGSHCLACVITLEAGPKRELSRHLAHDLSNRLAAVKGFAQMIELSPEATPLLQQNAREILQAVMHLQALADRIRNCELPATTAAPAAVAKPPAPIKAGQAKDPGRLLRLLIVEDDPAIAEILRYFSKDYYNAEHEQFPEKALDEIRREKFDLIITDLQMPRVSGLEILSTARRHQPKTPVVVISGLNKESPEAQAVLAQGAADFLEKPFGDTETVKTVFRKYAAQ